MSGRDELEDENDFMRHARYLACFLQPLNSFKSFKCIKYFDAY